MTQILDNPANLPAAANGNNVPAPRLNMKAPVRDARTLKHLLEISKQQLADVLPKHMTPERIMKVALIAVNKTPKLLECTTESMLQSIMQAAALGLDPGGALGSAYLVPYGNTCTLIPGYRGLIELARRSGEIVSINAEVVYKSDKFVYRKGTDQVLLHEPDYMAEQQDADIIGAYMVAHLKDGGKHVEFMNRQQIEKIRKGSKAGNYGPWKDHFSEMCRKTVVRRGVKYLPISSEKFANAIEIDNEHDEPGMNMTIDQRERGVAGLMNRITSRPVSEGQTFEPEPAMIEQAAAAQHAAADEEAEAKLREVSPSASSVAAEELPSEHQAIEDGDEAKPMTDAERVATWEGFEAAVDEAAKASKVDVEALDAWMTRKLRLVGKFKKEMATTAAWRLDTLAKVRAGTLD